MSILRATVPLLALCAWAAPDADRAVLQLLPGKDARVLHRAAVSPELDLVVAASRPWPSPAEALPWDVQTALSLFLQHRDNPGRIYRIAVERGPAHDTDELRLERATPSEVVFSCTPFKGRRCPNLKFVFDPRAKALVKRIDSPAFVMHRVFLERGKAVFAGADAARLIAVEFDPAAEQPFHVLAGAEAARYTRRLKTSEGVVLPPEPPSFHFGPGNRFTLASPTPSGAPGGPAPPVVTDSAAGRHFPLPQSTYSNFAVNRPARVKDGYARQHTRIEESIGPAQILDGTLWFAKSFYDAEGITGIGGFGYFDADARRYVLFSPPEISDWSANAMLVEPQAVWLALVRHSEYRGFPGGLLRFDRTTQTAAVLPLPEVIGDIARLGDHLVMATEFGIAVHDGATLRRYFIDETTSGSLRVVEALSSKTR